MKESSDEVESWKNGSTNGSCMIKSLSPDREGGPSRGAGTDGSIVTSSSDPVGPSSSPVTSWSEVSGA